MNCANHTERTATAFCQNCGKALCPECTRTADGLYLCQPCLLLRRPDAAGSQWAAMPSSAPYPDAQAGYTPVPGAPQPSGYAPRPAAYVPPPGSPSPVLAALLGFIPGVGAMYNGQFVKGLIHVVIFVILVGMANHWDPAGLLIAAWVFYQVFDAYHTAAARRDGRPLPDPLGLLDLSQRLGPAQAGYAPGSTAGYAPPPSSPDPGPPPGPPRGTSPGTSPSQIPGAPSAAGVPAQGGAADWTGVPVPGPSAYTAGGRRRRRGAEPVGALILIAIGVLALLNTLDVFNFDWLARGWPVIVLGIGVWLLIRRTATAPRYSAPLSSDAPAPRATGSSLSISPYRDPASPETPYTDVREEKR